jgi:UDP-N-acetylmuramate: L-alanyl-gamma-D-glutamyl-meso-diaminopimelate ligase
MRIHFIAVDKKCILIAGNHGKTTTAAMIMHVLSYLGIKSGHSVVSHAGGFDTIAGLSDEVQVAVLNGIAGYDTNDSLSIENYVGQFVTFTERISAGGSLIYFEEDAEAKKIALASRDDIRKIPYKVHGYFQNKTGFYAATHNRVVQVKFFGEQNMQNLSAARAVCFDLSVSEDDFYEAIKSFKGPS